MQTNLHINHQQQCHQSHDNPRKKHQEPRQPHVSVSANEVQHICPEPNVGQFY